MSKYHVDCTNTEPKPKKKAKQISTQASKPEEPPPEPEYDATDLLAVLNPNRACCCEVTARAVSDDVPKYLGLTNLRAELYNHTDSDLNVIPDVSAVKSATVSAVKSAANPNNSSSTKNLDSKPKL